MLNKVKVLVAQSCPALCNPMDYSPPGSSLHGILQARILEWIIFPSPGDFPNPGIKSRSPALWADSTIWATREAYLCEKSPKFQSIEYSEKAIYLFCCFNFLFCVQFLKVIFYLQLLQNIGCVPCAVLQLIYTQYFVPPPPSVRLFLFCYIY